jgi:hypothetical protein
LLTETVFGQGNEPSLKTKKYSASKVPGIREKQQNQEILSAAAAGAVLRRRVQAIDIVVVDWPRLK